MCAPAAAPRQPLAPTPYALFAPTAGTVPNAAITASKLAAGAAAGNLQAGGQSAVAGGGVVLSEQAEAAELINAGYMKIGRVNLIDEAWLARAGGPTSLPKPLARTGHSVVWTGTELIIWGGDNGSLLNTGARYNPAANTWTPTSTTNAPAARSGHSAVWTGSEMIVHGGGAIISFFNSGVVSTNTGARYNPATDTWTAIASGGGSRRDHVAFWTGSEMLVYGGTYTGSGIFGTGEFPRGDGARYNLAGNSWTTMTNSGAPTVRSEFSAVWNGTDMIVWGGYDDVGSFLTTRTNYGDGARYRPANNTWTAVSTAGAPFRRYGHSAVWSGSQMIVWGGVHREGFVGGDSPTNYNDGARYNSTANTWSSMATAGAPAPRYTHTALWANNQMVVWGGTDGTNVFNSGARYFPSANAWSNLTSVAQPAARSDFTTGWSGTEMIIWGGGDENLFYFDLGGRYNPTADTWTATAPTGERSERRGHTAVWTGSEMIVWGGFDGERNLNTGGRFNPALNTWSPMNTNGAPSGRLAHSAVWTGTQMIVWGGSSNTLLNTGGRYNPITDVWLATTTTGAPTGRSGHTAVWTGSEMIIWGGLDGAFRNTGARYNPVANSWAAMPTGSAPSARTSHAAVWTGTDMLVWGGMGGTIPSPFPLSTGGRYNRAANSWSALPTAGAPAARAAHSAVWTGDEILVWGGTDLTTHLNTGGRFHSVSNLWRSMTTNNAPSPRGEHTAVWVGTRMIVWGGFNGTNYTLTGGHYDPQTDAWSATLTSTNVPAARSQHVAVWSGTEMVIHGGWNGSHYFDDTYHYVPPRTMFLYLKP